MAAAGVSTLSFRNVDVITRGGFLCLEQVGHLFIVLDVRTFRVVGESQTKCVRHQMCPLLKLLRTLHMKITVIINK